MRQYKIFLTAFILIVLVPFIHANISLPSVFGSHMVLQQNSKVKLWGWGNPTEQVVVTVSWNTDTIRTVVNNQCDWAVWLETPAAGQAHAITIKGYNKVVLEDVLMGEVWLLSGQSNMEWSAQFGFNNSEEEVKKANHPDIRLFQVTRQASKYPQDNVEGQWKLCTPESMLPFSAIGYFFGRTLNDSLNVPIGLINTAWGGSPIEIWMPEPAITNDDYLMKQSQRLEDMAWSAREPGRAYNAMIAPLMPLNIAGVLWYQGETNAANPEAYTKMLSTLANTWRDGFEKDFSFFYAQIAPWNGYGPVAGVQVREAQRRALKHIEKSGMIVVSDIGDTLDIHPRNKLDAGLRFANLALNKTYGKTHLPSSGPIFNSYIAKGKKVTVHFDYGKGLKANGPALNMFEVKDENGQWHKAKARIRKQTVEVWSNQVVNPHGVRFAWHSTATPLLVNAYGLPTSCFTSEEDITK